MNIAKHGEEREPLNAWYSLITYVLWIVILSVGGFFN